jgi:hypothetical protein
MVAAFQIFLCIMRSNRDLYTCKGGEHCATQGDLTDSGRRPYATIGWDNGPDGFRVVGGFTEGVPVLSFERFKAIVSGTDSAWLIGKVKEKLQATTPKDVPSGQIIAGRVRRMLTNVRRELDLLEAAVA